MANPSTANNNDVVLGLDPGNVEFKPPAGISPTDYSLQRTWMTSLVTLQTPMGAGSLQRTSEMRGYWNYYGDHGLTFGDAAINSVWLETGRPSTAGDPVIGARVAMIARLADLDPTDTYSTQIIAGIFKIIGRDGTDLMIGTQPSVAFSRWVTASRPMGSAIFQFVIPNDRLRFAAAGYSAALDALRSTAAQGAGIMVRFCLYALRHDPALTTEAMHAKFERGLYISNPMTGRVLGSIGVWYADDMRSAPVGRVLQVPTSKYCVSHVVDGPLVATPAPPVATHGDVKRIWDDQEQRIVPHEARAGGPHRTLRYVPGPAVAVVDHEHRVVVLDVLNTFLEAGFDPQTHELDLTKIDIGTVNLALIYQDGRDQTRTAVIGPVPYDRTTYENQAGVVEVSYAAHPELDAYIDAGTLVLSHTGDDYVPGRIVLQEIDTLAIETDDRCVYVQEGEEASINLRVFFKGKPITRTERLRLQQWKDVRAIAKGSAKPAPGTASRYPVVGKPMPTPKKVQPHEQASAIQQSITVHAGGQARLKIAPKGPQSRGCYKVRFIPRGAGRDAAKVGTGPAFDTEFFASFRVLPADDYSDKTDEQITWEFVYQEVFSYYALLYPIMSTIIPWGPHDAPSDPSRVREFAALIKQFVDKDNLTSPLYMPITRELSKGKRVLIRRWCDLQMQACLSKEENEGGD